MITSLIGKKCSFALGLETRQGEVVGVDTDQIGWTILVQADNGDLINKNANSLTIISNDVVQAIN